MQEITRSPAAIDDAVSKISFNSDGLVPAIAQQHDTGEVLMMAWMNEDAVRETLATNRVCYWSRSRKGLWRKGETSGQQQMLKSFLIDCDGDTILLKLHQDGVACHTGRRNCFYFTAGENTVDTNADVLIDPADLYGKK